MAVERGEEALSETLTETQSVTDAAREAIEALQAAYEIAGDKAGADITGRLGIIYLRLGKLDDAIRYLRVAQGAVMAGQPLTAHVLVHLSNALAMRGQMTEAIDVLANNARRIVASIAAAR